MSCTCGPHTYTETMRGGCKAGGSAPYFSPTETMQGGCKAGGSAWVDIPTQLYDSYRSIWHLTEAADGTSHEYANSATGPAGTGAPAPATPAQAEGLYGSYAQQFSGGQYITVDTDATLSPNNALTISVWVKITSFNKERCIYSIGSDPYSISLEHNFLNQFQFAIRTATGLVKATAPNVASRGCWYHIAGVYQPNHSITLYVDGEPVRTKAVTTWINPSSMVSYIGKRDTANYPEGLVQELRLAPLAQPPELIEYQFLNGCGGAFQEFSPWESATS